jgi:hypothetical protein
MFVLVTDVLLLLLGIYLHPAMILLNVKKAFVKN